MPLLSLSRLFSICATTLKRSPLRRDATASRKAGGTAPANPGSTPVSDLMDTTGRKPRRRPHTNIWGAHLFTTHHRVYFCVDACYPRRCRISRVDSQVFVGINTAGTSGQWHKDHGEKAEHFFPWRRGNIRSGYASTKVVHFWRGATILGNDVVLGRSQIVSHIRLHCNGQALLAGLGWADIEAVMAAT
jgi:hypothetical protein